MHLHGQPSVGASIAGHAHERELHIAHIRPTGDLRVTYPDRHHLHMTKKHLKRTICPLITLFDHSWTANVVSRVPSGAMVSLLCQCTPVQPTPLPLQEP